MQKRLFRSTVIIFFMIVSASFSHKFYVSLIQVEFNAETEALEITMKIFTDDLEYAISGSQVSYGLITANEPPDVDSVLYNYIEKNFTIKINGKSYSLVYIGKEVELDVTWIYIEIMEIESIDTIEITDLMLTELFEDQVNLINVRYLGQNKGLLLNRNRTTGKIQIEH